MRDFLLARNNAGRLVMTTADGTVHEGVTPVRAFPVMAPDRFVAIMSAEGKEILWIDAPAELPEDVRTLIQEEIASRELMPEIHRIVSVSSFSTPCTWDVETDRGRTTFILKGEEDIRRIAGNTLLIADSNGLQFLIKDSTQLDKVSKKLLDRFR